VTLTAPALLCPRCHILLVSEEEEAPWCGHCEHSLDTFAPSGEPWPWNRITQRGAQLGFASDLLIGDAVAPGAETSKRAAAGAGVWLLGLISALLYLMFFGGLAAAAWLVFATDREIIGLLLLIPLWFMRPRFDRLKEVTEGAYKTTAENRPGFFALLQRVATAASAPMPDVVAFSGDWNTRSSIIGLRRRRVLVIGVPLWAALTPQERVALLAWAVETLSGKGFWKELLLQPALNQFGRWAEAFRPPKVLDPAYGGPFGDLSGLFGILWKMFGGSAAVLLWSAHTALNVLGSWENRRDNLKRDLLAARIGGTRAASGLMDVLATERHLAPYINPNAEEGNTLLSWHDGVQWARERMRDRLPRLRQLSNRIEANLFGSHPAPGRRHQFLTRLPYQDPAVVLTETESARIDRELNPYAEVFRKQFLQWRDGI
jgi:heat shock protein HtpX